MIKFYKYFLLITLSTVFNALMAAPYVPEHENTVVRVFAVSDDIKKINHLRVQLSIDKNNYRVLNKIVALYLKMGREKSDPRYFGYAEALILPYLKNINLPEQVYIHWADILQHRHDFSQALEVLNRLANNNSNNSQVYLMRAISHISRAEYQLALDNCKLLFARASHLISMACVSQVKSLTGELRESFLLLEETLQINRHSDREELGWAISLLADMAVRMDDDFTGEQYYRKAIEINQHDYYVLANYADLLLKQKKYRQVITLLNEFTYVDTLLLRLAIAGVKSNNDSTAKYIAELESSYRLMEIRGEDAHLRDQARFYHDVKNDSEKALLLAKKNWRVQKEPADIKLLLGVALTIKNKTELKRGIEWVMSQNLEDAQLSQIISAAVKL